jgi:hypothetical protein
MDILVIFFVAHERYCKKYKKETIMKNLAKEGSYAGVDNYFYTLAVLVYFEKTIGRGTERGRYYVVKKSQIIMNFSYTRYKKKMPKKYHDSWKKKKKKKNPNVEKIVFGVFELLR